MLQQYRATTLLFVVVFLITIHLHAQLEAKDLLDLPGFGVAEFAVSPDSELLVYTVTKAEAREPASDRSTKDDPEPGLPLPMDLWATNLRTGASLRICCEGSGSAVSPSWSTDGKQLAFYRSPEPYVASEAGLRAFAKDETLAVWDRQTGAIRQFLKGRLSTNNIWYLPLWIGDGHSVIVETRAHHDSVLKELSRVDTTGGKKKDAGTERSADSTIRVLATQGLVEEATANEPDGDVRLLWEDKRCDLTQVDLKTGKITTVLEDVILSHLALSPDRTKLVFSIFKGIPPNSLYETQDIYLVDLAGLKPQKLFSDDIVYTSVTAVFSWSPDGKYLAFPYEVVDAQRRRAFDIIVVNISDGSSKRIPADQEPHLINVGSVVWNEDGSLFSFIRSNYVETWEAGSGRLVSKVSFPSIEVLEIVSAEGNRTLGRLGRDYSLVVKVQNKATVQAGFWRVWPYRNQAAKLVEEDKSFSYYTNYQQLLADGSGIVFAWESADQPSEVYTADSEFKNVRQLTTITSTLHHVAMGRSMVVSWRDTDGYEVQGALLLPAGYTQRQRYPLVVQVYPTEQVGDVHRFGMTESGTYQNGQLFASRGYAVFRPNIRSPFRSPTSLMADAAKSVLPGVLKLIDMGIVDPDKIGVMGQSDGGYTTIALLTQSRLFKAGITISGYANLIEEYSYDYGRRMLEESHGLATTPWANREVFIANSPFFYLDRIESPLLIIAGSADTAVPPHNSGEVFAGLRRLGKTAMFIEYQGEDHGPELYSYTHQLDLCKRMLDWFGQFVAAGSNIPRADAK